MMTLTIAVIPFGVACLVFIGFFCEVYREENISMLLALVGFVLSAAVYFAFYGFFTALGLL